MTISNRITTVFARAYMYAFGSRMAGNKLNQLAESCGNDVGKLVNLAFNFEYKSKFSKSRIVNIRPLQVKSEVAELCRIVQDSNPKSIVEIGTASGGTLFLFAHVANPDKIISIDLPESQFGDSGYPFSKVPFFKSFGKKHVIQLIRADSHNEETISKVKSQLKGSQVDFLFIDGDHTYRGVKSDFQAYSCLVRRGGIVAFHDILPGPIKTAGEVAKFWLEIRDKYRYSEIVESQDGLGIGLLYT